METVEPEVQAFLGRWYQMYGSISSTLLTFGNAGPQDTHVSADYTLDVDGSTINVLNQGIRPDGSITKIWGKAKATDRPGQKKLSFSKFVRGDAEVKPPSFEGDYWIYHLGPMTQGVYSYAIVGGPTVQLGWDRTQLFVLARDPTTFKDLYDQEVLEWCESNGFTSWWNKPRKTGSVGPFKWLPIPMFTESDSRHGEFGQAECAGIKALEAPCDGAPDPRILGA